MTAHERVVTVVPEAGLHARPAAEFVQTAAMYDAEVRVGRPGDEDLHSAASMLAVTGLDVENGEDVLLVAEGDGAEDALDALEALLTSPEAELNDD
ncbi:HPr family phosphocarrier protein [Halobacteria archaeon AArc-dxtr1]|nr:HPr family phosphocarrier protein [Halobacteria archaeon AArc-dxtr1]